MKCAFYAHHSESSRFPGVEHITNFLPNNNIGSSFGQTTTAYRDSLGAVDPGGRILEFVFRLNF